MIKTFMKCIREFKLPTILTLLFIIGEVFIEVLIPFRTAALVNGVKAGMPMGELVRLGLVLVVMSLVSLCFGGGAALLGSKASSGFARNVRGDVFRRIQSFSFENIYKRYMSYLKNKNKVLQVHISKEQGKRVYSWR